MGPWQGEVWHPAGPLSATIRRRKERRWIGAVIANVGRGMSAKEALTRATCEIFPGLKKPARQTGKTIALLAAPNIAEGLRIYAHYKDGIELPGELLAIVDQVKAIGDQVKALIDASS